MITFKQFATYISEADGKSEDQLHEIWSKIFGDKKKKEEEEKEEKDNKKGKPMTAKDLEAKRKELADKRKEDLKKKRDEEWAKAKERIESGRSGRSNSRHDDHAWRAGLKEGKTSYSDEGTWKEEAQEKGYKVKKLSGDLMAGDQTWGAFDGDKKVGEFTEKEEGRGGWLSEAKISESIEARSKATGKTLTLQGDVEVLIGLEDGDNTYIKLSNHSEEKEKPVEYIAVRKGGTIELQNPDNEKVYATIKVKSL